MKKLNIMLLVMLIGLCVTSLPRIAFAGVDHADVPVSANIPDATPEITVVVKELNTPGQYPSDGTTVDTMSFGQLTHTLSDGTDAGLWYSEKYYCALIYTSSWGHPYEIRSSCAGLSDNALSLSLPAGSFVLTPGYAGADRWVGLDPTTAQDTTTDDPPGDLGTIGSAITGGSYTVIYASEPAASNRIIRAFYSLPPKGPGGVDPYPDYEPIPLTQLGGTYEGVVTITIAALG